MGVGDLGVLGRVVGIGGPSRLEWVQVEKVRQDSGREEKSSLKPKTWALATVTCAQRKCSKIQTLGSLIEGMRLLFGMLELVFPHEPFELVGVLELGIRLCRLELLDSKVSQGPIGSDGSVACQQTVHVDVAQLEPQL